MISSWLILVNTIQSKSRKKKDFVMRSYNFQIKMSLIVFLIIGLVMTVKELMKLF